MPRDAGVIRAKFCKLNYISLKLNTIPLKKFHIVWLYINILFLNMSRKTQWYKLKSNNKSLFQISLYQTYLQSSLLVTHKFSSCWLIFSLFHSDLFLVSFSFICQHYIKQYLVHNFSHHPQVCSLHDHHISILLICTDRWSTGTGPLNSLFHNTSVIIKTMCIQNQEFNINIGKYTANQRN